jgi:hypothetical protein
MLGHVKYNVVSLLNVALCTKPGKWPVLYLCVGCIGSVSFYHFDIWFWNGFDSMLFFVFFMVLQNIIYSSIIYVHTPKNSTPKNVIVNFILVVFQIQPILLWMLKNQQNSILLTYIWNINVGGCLLWSKNRLPFPNTWVHTRFFWCCVFCFVCLRLVSWTQSCSCLWIVHLWLPFRFSLTFIGKQQTQILIWKLINIYTSFWKPISSDYNINLVNMDYGESWMTA